MDKGVNALETVLSPQMSVQTGKALSEWVEWGIPLLAAILIALAMRKTLFALILVKGRSMSPTLANHELLFVTLLEVRLHGVQRGDVVICRYPNRKELFVKRVVGVPGDSVERRANVTYVNLEPLDEGRSIRLGSAASGDYPSHILGENEYFVVGDNRMNSHDSRDWKRQNPSREVGPISRERIVGRARYVLWPPSRWREIE